MVLKLYTNPHSTNGQRVAAVLHEKEVPFELHEISFTSGELRSPEYLEKQPFGQVPYIDDDGFILYESRAICVYIETKYRDQGTQGLIPTELKANALFQQAASVELAHFDDPAAKACFEKIFKPYSGLVTDEGKLQELLNTIEKELSVYEKILGMQKYLAGDELTLADLYHLPMAALIPAAGYKGLESKPNVYRYFNELLARKSWEAVKGGIKGTA